LAVYKKPGAPPDGKRPNLVLTIIVIRRHFTVAQKSRELLGLHDARERRVATTHLVLNLGRRAFGQIENADAGPAAFTNTVVDQAERAIQDCLVSRGLV
jgi:hypothetical protein